MNIYDNNRDCFRVKNKISNGKNQCKGYGNNDYIG